MDLVTVATYSTAAAAEMAKNFLADEDIRAFVEEGNAGDMLHLGGEVKLQVTPADAERASKLLDDAEFHPEHADDKE